MAKKNSRNSSKYPALNSGINLPSRKDLIDFDYLHKLDEKSLEFINKFVEETVVTNFNHHPLIKNLQNKKRNIIEDESVKTITQQINTLKENAKDNEKEIKRLRAIVKQLKLQNQETYSDKLSSIDKKLKELRDQFLLYPEIEDHREFYSENNARNRCLYTKTKTGEMLDSIEKNGGNEVSIYKSSDENDIIDMIERSKWEEEESRLREVFKDEKLSKKVRKS